MEHLEKLFTYKQNLMGKYNNFIAKSQHTTKIGTL